MNILIDGQTLETEEINRGIGNYFKQVINNMIKLDFVNNWYITVSDEKFLKVLDPWIQEKIIPVVNEKFSPKRFNQEGYKANEEYTKVIEEVINKYKITEYWNPNPVMVNVLFPNTFLKCNIYITFYDLIPLIFKNKYLDVWPEAITNEYKRRLDYINSSNCTLLFISEASKRDFDSLIGSKYKNAYVTFLGVEPNKFYRESEFKVVNKNKNIVYVGGFDFRKNLHNAVKAFAKMKKDYSEEIVKEARFFIVGKCAQEDRKEFEKFLEKYNVSDSVKVTGFISENDLSKLYNECTVFFFPSLYEGFGLPVLEALIAGARVLAANNSSIPEVGKDFVDYCDANNVQDMAEKLFNSLKAAQIDTIDIIKKRTEYALQYTWTKTAQETLDYLLDNKMNYNLNVRQRIAMVTPWPPQKTGIANYVYKIVLELKKYVDIDVFVDTKTNSLNQYIKQEAVELIEMNQLKKLSTQYDHVIYQLGNNSEFHKNIYELALEIPGIIEIHDYIMHPFMQHAFYMNGEKARYKEALEFYAGGKEHYIDIENQITYPDLYKYPMCHYIASKSKGTIVHSQWIKKQIDNLDNIYIIPHPSFEININKNKFNRIKYCERYNIEENEYIIACMGFVNKNKRPDIVIQAISNLRNQGYPIKLVFLGEAGALRKELEKQAEKLNVKDNMIITGFLDDQDYYEGLYHSDIVVNLRWPSMGESSGPLCEAFKYGKAVIVSNMNQYKEYPDDICWKVDVGEDEQIQLEEYIKALLKNYQLRQVLRENSLNYSNEILKTTKIAKMYLKMLQEI